MRDPAEGLPWLAAAATRVVGLYEPPGRRDARVEANARLTGMTGLVLAVLFVAEGITIPYIFPLLSWHVAIGIALIPLLGVKIASTLWRFTRYYLGDLRFRQAGPPHPFLRLLGPVLMVSTVILMASGVALWLAGPANDLLLLRVHQASFVVWFACVAVHFVSHVLRATRLAAADESDAKARTPRLEGARGRRRIVVGALAVGLVVGFASRTVTTGWTHFIVPARPPAAGAAPQASSNRPSAPAQAAASAQASSR